LLSSLAVLPPDSPLTDIKIEVFDNSTEDSTAAAIDLVYELSIDLKRMVWLPTIDITTLSAFPLNAILFLVEDGGIMMDERLYVLLRSNALLSVASKQNRLDTNDDIDNDSQVEEQAVSSLFLPCSHLPPSVRESKNHFKISLITNTASTSLFNNSHKNCSYHLLQAMSSNKLIKVNSTASRNFNKNYSSKRNYCNTNQLKKMMRTENSKNFLKVWESC
jgi:hypothetical protein